jgi:5'-nucleotidase/UDP-sugar diphosphatase
MRLIRGLTRTSAYQTKDRTYAITILHTNDHHGRFWQNGDGEYGMAARKTVIDGIRAEVKAGGYSLLLDGGDVNTGVPGVGPAGRRARLQRHEPAGLRRHGRGQPRVRQKLTVLAMQRKLAKFPMLSANIYRPGERMFEPYKMFNLGGVRVA